ncbi:HEPN domain-containing protein [Geobacter sp.]|uniref:HEPN domain-containing protein n=1 Tax=Geobacter sp. TaxID=46610 RepID=UPI00260E385A|nr:HEPN domain-containing protein [Geobacter sp.]
MSAIEAEIRHKVIRWLDYADEDLRLARHALTLSTGVPYRLVAYHAQQCAEKALKAFLVYHRIDFPYTHNISRLLELCQDKAQWGDSLLDAEELSVYAVTTRYPGEEEEVTRDETLRAIDLAAMVRERVRLELEAEIAEGGKGI